MEQAPSKYKYVYVVRFEGIKKAYTFGSDFDYTLANQVVVETARGLELGEIITEPMLMEDVQLSNVLKPIIRLANNQDIQDSQDNVSRAQQAHVQCVEKITQLKLDMNLINTQYTLDRAKVIFSYVADERVDFRELLRELAATFKCRIELRQVGARDKAKLIGGVGVCGQETCCSRFLPDFDVISINMAKNQMLALNIQKISGQCGKLMCCLKYENDIYTESKQCLPKLNSKITYQGSTYRVSNINVPLRTVHLSGSEDSVTLSFEEVVDCDKCKGHAS